MTYLEFLANLHKNINFYCLLATCFLVGWFLRGINFEYTFTTFSNNCISMFLGILVMYLFGTVNRQR